MDIAVLVFLVVGLALLVIGAEMLVRGASRSAAMVGISPLIIGLTVVAYGTSAPELVVGIQSSLAGQADIALGNVIGSNIFNVLLVLGLSALVAPLIVSQQLVRLDVPIMIGLSVLTLVLGLDGTLNTPDGVLLFLGGISYTGFLIYQSRKETNVEVQDEYLREYGVRQNSSLQQWLLNFGFIAVGMGLLILGSHWLVEGAIAIAEALSISELVIGLTIVAAGTSLPELATSVVASIRGERDIAVGNAIGSNIFNILIVLGLTSIVAPEGINVSTAALRLDLPVMIAVAIACLPIFFTGNVINRWEGLLFLGYYAVYTAYLILDTTNHESLPIFSLVMGAFVIPITVLTLLMVSFRAMQARRR